MYWWCRSCHCVNDFFFLMIRRPPRSTLDRSSAASDVYKRQEETGDPYRPMTNWVYRGEMNPEFISRDQAKDQAAVSYTHLRAHETVLDIVCRLLLEKKTYKKKNKNNTEVHHDHYVTTELTPHTTNHESLS